MQTDIIVYHKVQSNSIYLGILMQNVQISITPYYVTLGYIQYKLIERSLELIILTEYNHGYTLLYVYTSII